MAKTSGYIQVVNTRPQNICRGAVIDSKGRETPITERMIQQACRELETVSDSVYAAIIPRQDKTPGH